MVGHKNTDNILGITLGHHPDAPFKRLDEKVELNKATYGDVLTVSELNNFQNMKAQDLIDIEFVALERKILEGTYKNIYFPYMIRNGTAKWGVELWKNQYSDEKHGLQNIVSYVESKVEKLIINLINNGIIVNIRTNKAQTTGGYFSKYKINKYDYINLNGGICSKINDVDNHNVDDHNVDDHNVENTIRIW
jgi:hypothetical protein